MMTKKCFYISLLLLLNSSVLRSEFIVPKECDSPQLVFACSEIEAALAEKGRDLAEFEIRFEFDPELGTQAYRIESLDANRLTVSGGDSLGLMYGGLRFAEWIRLEQSEEAAMKPESGKPFLAYRGLKMNIPLDARTPSYDDTGDSARWNIATVWDFGFWQDYLDTMARYRYNALTLWNPHPFPSLIKLEKYPGVALSDVCRSTVPLDYWGHPRKVSDEDWQNLETIKTLSIDQKIAFWRKVLAYARDRGIEVYFITWNIHLDGAYGKHGITGEQDNLETIAYVRECVRELLATYPDLAGIGVTAGEMMKNRDGEFSKENWLWRTYGLGVKDVIDAEPSRKIRFIHRAWQSDLKPIMDAFESYPGILDLSFKYAKARIYAAPDPNFADDLVRQMKDRHLKSWWNLRNDDLFLLRWGDPDYTREFIRNFPLEQTAGFHMGSDGYVWARNYGLADPERRGELELDRHWYNFMQWGRLGYDPSLGRDFFEAALEHRFAGVDASRLYTVWAASSQIIPQVNRFFFKAEDFKFTPEGCFNQWQGFITVNRFIEGDSMPGTAEISITDYLKRRGKPVAGRAPVTPLDVAGNLERLASETLEGVAYLRSSGEGLDELGSVLTDLETMAWLGRYYASKIRGATALARYRLDGGVSARDESVAHLSRARSEWNEYSRLALSQYRPQHLARARLLDWERLSEGVFNDIVIAREAKTFAEDNRQN